MEITSKTRGPNAFKPLPSSIVDGIKNKISIGGFYNCVSCGFPFDATALDALFLPCWHVYHMLRFVQVCIDYGFCVAIDCNQRVPLRAKLMMGHKHASVKKEPSAGTKKETSRFVVQQSALGNWLRISLCKPHIFELH